jgi:hypothetical protein
MGGDPSKQSNRIAQASLDESRRQYNEQKAQEEAQKATAKANALGARTSTNMAYSNMFQQSTDYTTGTGTDAGYSLLTAGGTPSIIGGLLGMDNLGSNNNTLGG